MRDFARNVVSYMGFRDSMRHTSANPTHKRAKVTEQFTIKRCQSTTRECEFLGPIVRQQRVGMLQEGDEDQPVVHPVRIYLVYVKDPESGEWLTRDRAQGTGGRLVKIRTGRSRR